MTDRALARGGTAVSRLMDRGRTADQIDAQRRIFDAMLRFITDNASTTFRTSSVLEFGSGRFGYANFYQELFDKCYALDIYDFSASYPDIEFLLSEDQLTIPLPNASIDVVASHSVLEHVVDIRATIAEIDRVLRVGGYALLTVSPLYWSSAGGHLYTQDRRRLVDWEHLDPQSEYYLEGRDEIAIPLGGFLNRLTVAQLLEAVGLVPWNIEQLERKTDVTKSLPDFLGRHDRLPVDLHTKEFKLLARKTLRFDGARAVPRDG